MSVNTGIREMFLRYCPSMVEVMTAEDLRLLHRLRRFYHQSWRTIEEWIYMCAMTECINQKLLCLDCMCTECFIVWDVLEYELCEFMSYTYK